MQIQLIITFVICFCFCVVYLVFFFKLYKFSQQQKHQTNKMMMLFPFVYVATYTIRYFLAIIDQYWYSSLYIDTALDLCFVITHAIFYYIMILRLKLAFQMTEYQISKRNHAISILLLCILIVINLLYFLVFNNGADDESLLSGRILEILNEWESKQVHNILFMVLICCNIILAVIVIYHFIKNIVKMIIDQQLRILSTQSTLSPPLTTPKLERNKTSLSHRQLNLLSIAIQYGLLCSICIIVTNIHFCGWITFSLGAFENKPVIGLYFEMIWESLWKVVLIVNFTCILLTFPKLSKDGYNCFCSSCHQSCLLTMEFCVVGHIERRGVTRTEHSANMLRTKPPYQQVNTAEDDPDLSTWV